MDDGSFSFSVGRMHYSLIVFLIFRRPSKWRGKSPANCQLICKGNCLQFRIAQMCPTFPCFSAWTLMTSNLPYKIFLVKGLLRLWACASKLSFSPELDIGEGWPESEDESEFGNDEELPAEIVNKAERKMSEVVKIIPDQRKSSTGSTVMKCSKSTAQWYAI